MTRVSAIYLMERPQEYHLCVQKRINFMEEYADFAEQAFEQIQQYLSSFSLLPAGAPVVCFYNQELENLNLAIGFPIVKEVPSTATISCLSVASQKVVTAIDLGPYEESDNTLIALFKWLEEHAYEAAGPIYYYYLNDPDQTEEQLLTKMVIPLQ